jgi:two-component system, NarL family, sensor histidine kinase UhpB
MRAVEASQVPEKTKDLMLTETPDSAPLVVHVLRRVEAERRAVEHELHDEVSGMLAAARMDVSALRNRMVQSEELREHFLRIDGAIDRAIKATRHVMQRLRPALLEHFGLPVALKHHVEETCRAAAVNHAAALPEEIGHLDPDLQIAAFRVVQELLGDGAGLSAFNLRLHEARGLVHVGVEMHASAAVAASAASQSGVAALRVWIESLGGGWTLHRDGLVTTCNLTLPCKK